MKRLSQQFPRLLVYALLWTSVQCALAAQIQTVVGEIGLVIGVARVISASGNITIADRGRAVHIGDRVETESGGHVHIRFIDGGRISVRPSSRLQIEDYSYSAQQSVSAAIKFRLDEGVVRSITGEWGEAARERFRLNTPVAAIGVKGTDFVVRTDANVTAASVNTGAIILAALTVGCEYSLGPCRNGGEKVLSQDMKGQMLALDRGQVSPRLVPLVDLMVLKSRNGIVEQAVRVEKSSATEGSRGDSSQGEKPVAVESPASSHMVSTFQPTVRPELIATPSLPVVAAPLPQPVEVSQLVWGRYAWASAVEGDYISKSFEQARENGRQVTISNGVFGLYRDGADNGQTKLSTSDAKASFRLAGSSAQLVTNTGTSQLVTVDSGKLDLDFSRRTFTTELAVTNATLGPTQIIASGSVADNGNFLSKEGNAHVAGALSIDAREAGYLFEKATISGALRGITLWGR